MSSTIDQQHYLLEIMFKSNDFMTNPVSINSADALTREIDKNNFY